MPGPGGGYVNKRNRSVDASHFAMVPRNDVPRSAFDMSHTHKTTFDAGYLVPVLVQEVLPGDSMRARMTALARLATPIVPLMDNLHLESFFFFVPNRLVWENWARFMGEQLNPADTTEYLVPQMQIGVLSFSDTFGVGTLEDYFGVWPGVLPITAPIEVSSLPFRAYNLIWNEWFRDQDLQDPVVVDVDDGPDTIGDYVMLQRGKRHDYFTSCRPWPQKPSNLTSTGGFSDAGPFIPGGAYSFPDAGAPVTGIGVEPNVAPTAGPINIAESGSRTVLRDDYYSDTAHEIRLNAQPAGNFPNVRVLINDIRTANQIQLLMERNARGGTRYTEILRSHFGVMSPDGRLQRPEYLGGGHTMVQINPVAQTAPETGGSTVLGELAAVGTAIANHGFSSVFVEHGFVIGLVCVRADLTYQQGLNRMWSRRGRYDFYWPALAHLGEQAVFNREIFMDGSANDLAVFGYQERWAEYRYLPNRISGGFRSIRSDSLDVWHLAQEFSAAPALNDTFIRELPPVERVLQTTTTAGFEFLFDSVFDLRMVRALPMFSIPGMGPRL